jgi:hypothetical protein
MDGLTVPTSPMQALQADHERLLNRLDDSGGVPDIGFTHPPLEHLPFETQALIHEARAYIERSKEKSEWISDGRDRSQLRANLRFWASYLLNYTGVYPDTTLRPARLYMGEFSASSARSLANYEADQAVDDDAFISNGEMSSGLVELEKEDGETGEGIETLTDEASVHDQSPWSSGLSRFFGMIAILVVGVIPLAAVCLALSLFYNLDNQSPWVSAGNAATQTATAALRLPSPTPIALQTKTPARVTGSAAYFPESDLPLLIAQVTTGEPSGEGSGCAPVLALSFEAPKAVGDISIPQSSVTVYVAGTEEVVAQVTLEPGGKPQLLKLQAPGHTQTAQDWLVQGEHPWIGMEAVILSAGLFEDCENNQVSIVYQSQSGVDGWQQAMDNASSNQLSLHWKLLTWGPQALHAQTWVAAIMLEATGGNGKFVYYAEGDLAAPPAGYPPEALLTADQVVLEQLNCGSAVVQVGVTSGGLSVSRALAIQTVLPECR